MSSGIEILKQIDENGMLDCLSSTYEVCVTMDHNNTSNIIISTYDSGTGAQLAMGAPVRAVNDIDLWRCIICEIKKYMNESINKLNEDK